MKLGEGNMGSLCTVFLHFSVNLYFQKKKKKKSDGAMHEKANRKNLTQHLEHGKKVTTNTLTLLCTFNKSTNLKTQASQTIQTISADSMTGGRILEFSYSIISYGHGKIFFRLETVQVNKEPVHNINVSTLFLPQIFNFNLRMFQSP